VRRLLLAGFVLAALAATSSSAAPKLTVTLAAPPSGLRAATAWTATVTVRRGGKPLAGAGPVLTFRNGLTARTVTTAPAGKRGSYRARISLPFSGTWSAEAKVKGARFKLRSINVAAAPAVTSILPTADAFASCGGERDFLPQYSVALEGSNVWVGCRGLGQLRRFDAATGNTTAIISGGGSPPHSLAAGGGAVWTVGRGPVLTRVDAASGKAAQDTIVGDSAYLWFAAGSVWVADDAASKLLRVDPATRRVQARIDTGSGTSAFVTDGTRAWFTNHRDATLDRLDLATNAVTHLGKLPGEAPERMTLLGGSLWVTGRGTDLLRVNPDTGAVQATIEIGTGGIDVAAAGGRIWVANASDADDRQGLPVMEHLYAVDPATNRIAETLTPTARLVVDGVASDGTTLWIADVSGGRLYRVRRG
jgi:DNA-binding beta-propeller fold protein YncE